MGNRYRRQIRREFRRTYYRAINIIKVQVDNKKLCQRIKLGLSIIFCRRFYI